MLGPSRSLKGMEFQNVEFLHLNRSKPHGSAHARETHTGFAMLLGRSPFSFYKRRIATDHGEAPFGGDLDPSMRHLPPSMAERRLPQTPTLSSQRQTRCYCIACQGTFDLVCIMTRTRITRRVNRRSTRRSKLKMIRVRGPVAKCSLYRSH